MEESSAIARASSMGANLAKSTLAVAHGPVPLCLCVFLHSTLCHEIQGSHHWPAMPSQHPQEEHRGKQLAFPWRFNSSMSYSVFLAFLCSNYSSKIINFFLISTFHLASYTEISCRGRIQTIGQKSFLSYSLTDGPICSAVHA